MVSYEPKSLTAHTPDPMASSSAQINVQNQLPLKVTINYPSWLMQFEALLTALALEGFIDGTRPCSCPTIFVEKKPEDKVAIKPNPDYVIWFRQDKLILILKYKPNPDYVIWLSSLLFESTLSAIRQDKLIIHAIIFFLSESTLSAITGAKTSQEAMKKICNTYASKTRSRIMSLKKRISMIQQGSLSIT